MDFFPSSDVHRAPPEATRITSLSAEPLPDGRKVRVQLEITPFEQPPSLELTVFDAGDRVAANTTILETLLPRIAITMHLRGELAEGEYHLTATLFYSQLGPVHETTHTFTLAPGQPDAS